MLKDHEKFRLKDVKNLNHLLLEVNWEPDNELTNDCKFIKATFPGNQTAIIKKEDFMQMLFAIGNPEEQRKSIPVTLHKVRWYETVLSVVAKKDIAKGEKITFPIKLSLPTERDEIIAEVKKKSGLLT